MPRIFLRDPASRSPSLPARLHPVHTPTQRPPLAPIPPSAQEPRHRPTSGHSDRIGSTVFKRHPFPRKTRDSQRHARTLHAHTMVGTVEKDVMTERELLLERSRAITLQGRDKMGRAVVRIVGKHFPARALGGRAEEALRGYLRKRVLPEVGEREFVVVYMHSLVDRGDNFPGVGAIRSAYESLPAKEMLRAVYFVHPGLQARLFFATFGRFLFSSGLYEKLSYMSRLEYLWAHVHKGELEVPECVRRHDEELERRPLMDYGIEATDRRCMFDAASMDTSASLHSLRCIS